MAEPSSGLIFRTMPPTLTFSTIGTLDLWDSGADDVDRTSLMLFLMKQSVGKFTIWAIIIPSSLCTSVPTEEIRQWSCNFSGCSSGKIVHNNKNKNYRHTVGDVTVNNRRNDLIYVVLEGLDQVDFGVKNKDSCLQGIHIGVMQATTEEATQTDWTHCASWDKDLGW